MKFPNMTLNKADPKEFTNIFRIEIEGDENDGDYKIETTECSPEEMQEYLPLLQLIKEGLYTSSGDNERNEIEIPDEMVDEMWDLTPYSEHGMHSINIQSVSYFDETGQKFDVTLAHNGFPELKL